MRPMFFNSLIPEGERSFYKSRFPKKRVHVFYNTNLNFSYKAADLHLCVFKDSPISFFPYLPGNDSRGYIPKFTIDSFTYVVWPIHYKRLKISWKRRRPIHILDEPFPTLARVRAFIYKMIHIFAFFFTQWTSSRTCYAEPSQSI